MLMSFPGEEGGGVLPSPVAGPGGVGGGVTQSVHCVPQSRRASDVTPGAVRLLSHKRPFVLHTDFIC